MARVAPRLRTRVWRGLTRGVLWALSLLLPSLAMACPVVSAAFSEPTDRYPHAVLGDNLEWAMLEVTDQRGKVWRLPADGVYEDLTPRLWDITGDGCPEVVVVQSHPSKGAQLLAIQHLGDKLDRLATPHIGTRFRWLAPVAAADFNGNGIPEVAFVDRPHLAKTLRIWELDPARSELRQNATLPALTNHRIGEDFITGGLRDCGARPEMVLVDASWSRVIAVAFKDGAYVKRDAGPFEGPTSVKAALSC